MCHTSAYRTSCWIYFDTLPIGLQHFNKRNYSIGLSILKVKGVVKNLPKRNLKKSFGVPWAFSYIWSIFGYYFYFYKCQKEITHGSKNGSFWSWVHKKYRAIPTAPYNTSLLIRRYTNPTFLLEHGQAIAEKLQLADTGVENTTTKIHMLVSTKPAPCGLEEETHTEIPTRYPLKIINHQALNKLPWSKMA